MYVLFFFYPSKSHTKAVVVFSLQPGQVTFDRLLQTRKDSVARYQGRSDVATELPDTCAFSAEEEMRILRFYPHTASHQPD
jgi:hypothetical protein